MVKHARLGTKITFGVSRLITGLEMNFADNDKAGAVLGDRPRGVPGR